MNLTKIIRHSIIGCCFLFLASCNKHIFLSRKYCFTTIKHESSLRNFEHVDHLRQINTSIAKQHNVIIGTQTSLVKHLSVQHIEEKNTDVSVFSKPLNKLPETIHKSIPIIKKIKKNIPEPQKTTHTKNFVKAALLLLLFWIIVISLFTNVFAIEIASLLVTLQIIGIVLLAATIWLALYGIFNYLIKKS
jgi:hypothetical protein